LVASSGLFAVTVAAAPSHAHARPSVEQLGRIVKDYHHTNAEADFDYDLRGAFEQVVMKPVEAVKEALGDIASSVDKALHHPHPPGPPGKDHEDYTIYEIINACDGFKYLTKAVNFSEDALKKLNDSEAQITFFAAPDSALRPPKHRHGHGFDLLQYEHDLSTAATDFSISDLSSMIDDLELSAQKDKDDKDKDKDRKRRKKILKAIVTAVLNYHILPAPLDVQGLGAKTTHATNLNLHSGLLDGEPVRIKVEPAGLLTPAVINVGSRVTSRDHKAKNGFLHVVSRPLLPPPAVFQELFLIPAAFSTFTSAIQRVRLADSLDIRYDTEKHKLKGTNTTTVFVPSNRAFNKLPTKLKLFLFSPFGERVLKKLLQFHVVPDFVFHADYTHNVTAKLTTFHHPSPSYTANLTTLLPGSNGTLPVSVTQYNMPLPHPIPGRDPIPYTVTLMEVNGLSVSSKLRDIPALNGAVHVVGEVLNPVHRNGKHHHGHHGHHGLLEEIMGVNNIDMDTDANLYEEAFDEDCDEWEDEVGDEIDLDEDVDEEATGWEGWEDWLVEWAERD
jgi:uncharacterized surface protein with fasciclin (FAS1) repeats